MDNPRNPNLGMMDALAIVSFMLGLANYEENLGQSQVQESISQAVGDIHSPPPKGTRSKVRPDTQ